MRCDTQLTVGLAMALALLVSPALAEPDLSKAPPPQDPPTPYARAIDKRLQQVETGIEQGPYGAAFDSIGQVNETPEWFKDAKLGIYFHWGVYSVPAYGSEWYPRKMHRIGYYKHHKQTYGSPKAFPYSYFVSHFGAEKFDAQAWAKLFKEAGARFAGPVAEHHDGYAMWDSSVTPWNAADTGPKADLTGRLEQAIRAEDMRFVTTFHHARNNLLQKSDGSWTGHYEGVGKHFPSLLNHPYDALLYGYMPKDQFEKMWLAKLGEVIDQYEPDLIWFDSWLHTISRKRQAQFAAYYYNRAEAMDKSVVVTRKQDDLPLNASIEDYEKGRPAKLMDRWWLTDDTISRGSWCYTQGLKIKSTARVLHDFIDIVAKRGCLLLNISPKADGTIPQNQKRVLHNLGAWLEVNGEAIYATRPWATFGEGPTRLKKGGHFVKGVSYTAQDVRYTQSKDGDTLYAIALGWPSDDLVLDQVRVSSPDEGTVALLGRDGKLTASTNDEGSVVIDVPNLPKAQRPCEHAFVFKLDGVDAHPPQQ